MPPGQGKRWVFTLNNPTLDERTFLNTSLNSNAQYAVVGREHGASLETPHLQGFVIFNSNQRFNAAKALLSPRAHLEVARGTSKQASDYCKKENDYEEFGTLPDSPGKRNDLEEFRDWIKTQPSRPTAADVAENFPSIYVRYRSNAMSMVDLLYPKPVLVVGEFRDWQRILHDNLQELPDDRTVRFIVDEEGGKGKSWFVKYYMSNHEKETQRLSVGKRDDLAYVIDVSKSIFLFDIPRTQLEYLQYNILESLKDQMIFSPKYESVSKVIPHKVHVTVFCNEEPDLTKMSTDRYIIIRV